MKKFLLLIGIAMLFFIQNGFAFLASFSGQATLFRSATHDGITVSVYSISNGELELISSTTTAANGSYSLSAELDEFLGVAIASISFKKDGYDSTAIISKTIKKSSASVTLEPQILSKPGEYKSKICVVTKDSSSGNNLIVWNSRTDLHIVRYIISKKNDLSGKYDSIGSIPITAASIYEDVSTNKLKSETYTIQAVYDDHTKSLVGSPQRSIQIKSTLQAKNLVSVDFLDVDVLNDNETFGAMQIDSIFVYRGTSAKNMKKIRAFNKTSLQDFIIQKRFTQDTLIGKEPQIYQVGFLLSTPCSEKLKSDSGPFSQSLSNMSEANLVFQNEFTNSNKLLITPNPSTNVAHIQIPNDGEITIIASNGAMIFTKKVTAGTITLQNEISEGIYLVNLKTKDTQYSEVLYKTGK